MHFAWKNELVSGVSALDKQHKLIFECINEYFKKCDAGAEAEELELLFRSLDNYTREHFCYEENMQKYSKYPGIEEQQKQHALFLVELLELKTMVDSEGPSREVTLKLKGNLIRWFTRHINILDREFVKYFNKK